MDLSVVIVSFNTKDRLRECLQRVFSSATKFTYEVFVVDNASSDGSAEMVVSEFPAVKLIKNTENVGYAKANNIAMRAITSPNPAPSRGGEKGEVAFLQSRYLLLLNPDVEIASDSFDKMISFMDNDSSVGIAGCKVVKSDGSFDRASMRNFPDLKNSLRHFLGLPSSYHPDFSQDKIASVDSVMGAFLMIRRDAVDKIGLLDEAFFMYGEDLDWCMRAKQAGFQVKYAPVTTVIHHKGSSSRNLPGKALYEFHRAMFVFYDKHYASKHSFFVNYFVKLGIWTRYIFKVILNSFRKEKYVSR